MDGRPSIEDLTTAIRIAKVPSILNKSYDEWAQELGSTNIAARFESEIFLTEKYPIHSEPLWPKSLLGSGKLTIEEINGLDEAIRITKNMSRRPRF
jgi:hypothetical protein